LALGGGVTPASSSSSLVGSLKKMPPAPAQWLQHRSHVFVSMHVCVYHGIPYMYVSIYRRVAPSPSSFESQRRHMQKYTHLVGVDWFRESNTLLARGGASLHLIKPTWRCCTRSHVWHFSQRVLHRLTCKGEHSWMMSLTSRS